MGFWGMVFFIAGGLFVISFIFGKKGKRTKDAAKEVSSEFPKILLLCLLVAVAVGILG